MEICILFVRAYQAMSCFMLSTPIISTNAALCRLTERQMWWDDGPTSNVFPSLQYISKPGLAMIQKLSCMCFFNNSAVSYILKVEIRFSQNYTVDRLMHQKMTMTNAKSFICNLHGGYGRFAGFYTRNSLCLTRQANQLWNYLPHLDHLQ